MKNTVRNLIGVILFLCSVGLLVGGFQQWRSDISFRPAAEELYFGAFLVLLSGLGLIFKRQWTTAVWGATLIYYFAITVYVYGFLVSGPGWLTYDLFHLLPLVAGLVFFKFLPMLVRGGTGNHLSGQFWHSRAIKWTGRSIIILLAFFLLRT